MSRDSVTKEIEQLKAKLEQRKKLEQADADVTKAKEAVVSCLRTHDRRPLDCWKEVETFKHEVGRFCAGEGVAPIDLLELGGRRPCIVGFGRI